jgi:hypothetical protein
MSVHTGGSGAGTAPASHAVFGAHATVTGADPVQIVEGWW